MDDHSPVVEADIIEEDTKTRSAAPEQINDAQVLLNLEEMIKTTLASIDREEYEAKRYKEGVDDILLNDETYQTHLKTVNEAKKVLATTKKEVLKHPAAAELDAKLKDLKATIKERKESLSDYVAEYFRMSGATSIQIDDTIMDIVQVAKLVKRSAPKKNK